MEFVHSTSGCCDPVSAVFIIASYQKVGNRFDRLARRSFLNRIMRHTDDKIMQKIPKMNCDLLFFMPAMYILKLQLNQWFFFFKIALNTTIDLYFPYMHFVILGISANKIYQELNFNSFQKI